MQGVPRLSYGMSSMQSLLVFILVHQTSHTLSQIDESQVESLAISRTRGNYDVFTVKMKPNSQCSSGVVAWCQSSSASYHSTGFRTCSCICNTPRNTFFPSNQTCGDSNMAAKFGGCKHYHDGQNLLKVPVDLTSRDLSINLAGIYVANRNESCSLVGKYVYNYNGFQSKWEILTGDFFSLQRNGLSYRLKWRNTYFRYSGFIVRLNVTCTSSTSSCVLFKTIGTVIYNASQSASSSLGSGYSTLLPSSALSLPPTSSLKSSVTPSVRSLSSLLQPHLSPAKSSVMMSSSVIQTSTLQKPLPSTQSQTVKLFSSATDQAHLISSTKHQSLPTTASVHTTPGLSSTSVKPVIITVQPAKTTRAASSSSTGGVAPGSSGTRTGGSDNGVLVGAAVGGAVALGIFVVIIIVLWKRRKMGASKEKQNKPVKNPVYTGTSGSDIQLEVPKGSEIRPSISQDNQPTYQGLINNGQSDGTAIYSGAEGNYDNCTVYQTLDKENPGPSVYLGLSKGLPEGTPTTGLPNSRHSTMSNPKLKPSAGGIPSSNANGTIGVLKSNSATGQPKRGPSISQEPVYNVLDGPDTGPRTTAEPLYNVLEGHEYATPNVDPLYNVLDGPDSNRSVPKSGPNTVEEALYNVLEGPDATNGPSNKQGTNNDAIYNVLEAPDSDKNSLVAQGRSGPVNEPLYSVLEEQVGDGSKQNAPNKSSSIGGVANPAYEQTLDFGASYAAVNRPGARGDSLYEPLRRPGQDVYEPLG